MYDVPPGDAPDQAPAVALVIVPPEAMLIPVPAMVPSVSFKFVTATVPDIVRVGVVLLISKVLMALPAKTTLVGSKPAPLINNVAAASTVIEPPDCVKSFPIVNVKPFKTKVPAV